MRTLGFLFFLFVSSNLALGNKRGNDCWSKVAEFPCIDGIDIFFSDELFVTHLGYDGFKKLSRINETEILELASFDVKCENPIFVSSANLGQLTIYFKDEFRKKRLVDFGLTNYDRISDVNLDSINLPKFFSEPRVFKSNQGDILIVDFEMNDTLWFFSASENYAPKYKTLDGSIHDVCFQNENTVIVLLEKEYDISIAALHIDNGQKEEIKRIRLGERLVRNRTLQDFRLSLINDSLLGFWYINDKTEMSSIHIINIASKEVVGQFEFPGQVQKIVMNNENIWIATTILYNAPVVDTPDGISINFAAQIYRSRISDLVPNF